MFHYLFVRRKAASKRLTLNRPEVRNAFNDEVGRTGSRGRRRGRDAGCVVVMAGAGRCSAPGRCGCLDGPTWPMDAGRERTDARVATTAMLRAVNDLPVPVIGRASTAPPRWRIRPRRRSTTSSSPTTAPVRLHRGEARTDSGESSRRSCWRRSAPVGGPRTVPDGRRFDAQHALDIGLVPYRGGGTGPRRRRGAVVRGVFSAGPRLSLPPRRSSRPPDASSKTPPPPPVRRSPNDATSAEGQEGPAPSCKKRKPGGEPRVIARLSLIANRGEIAVRDPRPVANWVSDRWRSTRTPTPTPRMWLAADQAVRIGPAEARAELPTCRRVIDAGTRRLAPTRSIPATASV